MGFHTSNADRAAKLDGPTRSRLVSREKPLSHLGVAPEHIIADLGSGTGFFTDEVVPHAGTFYAVGVRAVVHDYYRKRGAPNDVELITADVASLPFDDNRLDTAFSTTTYHEFATDGAFVELARVVRPGGAVVMIDQSTSGSGEDDPPRGERSSLGDAVSALEAADFTVTHGKTRCEMFVCIARRWRERTREVTPLELNSEPCRS